MNLANNDGENLQTQENIEEKNMESIDKVDTHEFVELTDADIALIEQIKQDREQNYDYDREQESANELGKLLDDEGLDLQYDLWLAELRHAREQWYNHERDVELER